MAASGIFLVAFVSVRVGLLVFIIGLGYGLSEIFMKCLRYKRPNKDSSTDDEN